MNQMTTFLFRDSFNTVSNDNDAGNMFVHQPARVDPVSGLAIPAPGLDGYNPLFFIPGSVGYIEATPGNNTDTNSDRDISLNTEQNTFIGRIDWTLNDLDIVSITGYEQSSKDGFSDSDSTTQQAGRGNGGSS